MTFQQIADLLQATAASVDANATFHRGRRSDTSLKSIDSNVNLVFVEDSIQVTLQWQEPTEPWIIRMGFSRQDSPESEAMEANNQSTTEARDTIFTATLALARAFFEKLDEDLLPYQVGFKSQPVLRQATRFLAGTFTGWVAEFTLLNTFDCE